MALLALLLAIVTGTTGPALAGDRGTHATPAAALRDAAPVPAEPSSSARLQPGDAPSDEASGDPAILSSAILFQAAGAAAGPLSPASSRPPLLVPANGYRARAPPVA